MIKTILNMVSSFFVRNKSYLLLGIVLIFCFSGAYRLGIKNGKLMANQEHSELQAQQAVDALNQFIEGTKQLTTAAHEASKQLASQIVERKLYDEQSTKLLNDALKATADSRTGCVFDDSVLQLIDNARNNAVRATTNGLTSSTSGTVRTASNSAQ